MKLYKNVFVTVGTTKFDYLCETITQTEILNAVKKIGCEEITIQIGKSNIEPGSFTKDGINFNLYRYKDSLQEDIKNADLIISHAGAGSCLEALEAGKPLLVVVNEDLMDNHQLELAEQLQIDGFLYYCTCDTMENTLLVVDFETLHPFTKPSSTLLVKYLDNLFFG